MRHTDLSVQLVLNNFSVHELAYTGEKEGCPKSDESRVSYSITAASLRRPACVKIWGSPWHIVMPGPFGVDRDSVVADIGCIRCLEVETGDLGYLEDGE